MKEVKKMVDGQCRKIRDVKMRILKIKKKIRII